MSEDFDDALTNALDQVARNASPRGSDAAKIRGRKRAVRQKIALSAVSLAVVAISATTAFTLTAEHNGAPQLTGATPHKTATVTASGSPSAGASTAQTQTQTTASSPSSTTPSDTGSASTGTSTSGSVSANPHQVQSAAWLSASDMPFASTQGWSIQSSKTDSVQQLTPTVGYIPSNTGFQALTTCGDPAAFMRQTIGGQVESFDSTPASNGNNQAVQYVFFFSSPAAAQQAYSWLQTQYTSAGCGGLVSSGAQLTEVGTDGSTGMAWLSEKGTSGWVDLPLYDREYFVVRGDTLAYVSVVSYPHLLPKTYDDAGELSTIAGHLCVYGGSCS